VPQPPLDPLQPVLQGDCFDGIVVRQTLGVLPEPGQPHGDVKPVQMMFSPRRQVADERADAVAAVGQHRNRLIPGQFLAPQYLTEPELRCGILVADQAEVAVVAILGPRLADDDLELLPLVVPVPEIATVDPDNDRFPRDRRWLVSGGTVIAQARLAGAEVGVVPGGDPVQVLADGLWVGRAGDRQDILEQGGHHAKGDQGCPAALQVEQLRGAVVSEQLGQRAEGLAVRRVAPTAVKARACERNMAERGAEDDRVLSLAAQTAAAGGAAAMPRDVGRRLGLDHGVLEPSEQILGVR
jgi:hypothetical protein